MGFTSEVFLFIYMPISIVIYLVANRFGKIQINNLVLLLLNLLFYAWSGWNTLGWFLVMNVMVYLLGQMIYLSRIKDGKPMQSKTWLCLACIVGIGYLFLAKYAEFVIQQINQMLKLSWTTPSMIVPIGISFLFFEALSYIIDVYRGDALPGTLFDVTLFLSLFPKLVSGPIVLWKDFAGQIHCRKTELNHVVVGIDRIIIGFAKKAILADSFGKQINVIEEAIAVSGVDAVTMWLRAVLYFFQIYYDFSGYSDIAIGLSRIFGFTLKENFNFPYISGSISEFWRRWHISLGTWFREYIYIPLGGNKKGNVYFNLFVVFLLTGIWHGANWTFFILGNRKWYFCHD